MDREGWTTVQNRKAKNNRSNGPKPVDYEFDSFDKADCQDWKPVVLQKRTVYPKKSVITPGSGYVTVATGRTGQPSDYDPRRQAKLANATDCGKIKRVGRETGIQLQQARAALKLTQKDLAQKMNVPLTVVSSWENGTAVHNGAMIQKFKKHLGT